MDMGKVAQAVTKAVKAQTPQSNTPQRAQQLASKPTCKNLYQLKQMNFTKFTSRQRVNLATTILAQSATRVGALSNPKTGDLMSLRFALDTFIKLAGVDPQLAPLVTQARSMLAKQGLTEPQIRQNITFLKMGLGMVATTTMKHHAPMLKQAINVLTRIENSPHLLPAWKWITAAPQTIKANIAQCK